MSPELRLITAPRDTYAALARAPTRLSAVTALRRPATVTLVIGASMAMAATGRATPALVLSTTVTWSYIVLLQLAIALPLVAPAARRTVGVARAVDLFFTGHAPWSLFVLAVAAAQTLPLGWPTRPVLWLALLPLILTARIVAAFFREVLAMDGRAAVRMMLAHQAITWTVFVAVNWIDSAYTPRLVELWRF